MEKIKLFEKYNLNLTEEKLNKLNIFYSELIFYNNSFNLTAITEENEVFIKHFLDSIFPEFLIEKNSSVIDIGAGAGFPSIPLKIYRPDLNVTMIDSLNKRVNFLNDVIKKLELENISAFHARAEDFAKTSRESFDYAVVRAVAKIPTLIEYAFPLLKVGGRLLCYKGGDVEEELKQSENALKILGGVVERVEKFNLEGNSRTIVLIKKLEHTPSKYPRSKNLPKLKPL
ncbi:MAG TPA: 16S rRNA (guanine(527)-N(7))-methyltransferase RsmG [Candidatus Caccopulliclostridium gallistercoris]|uniref:Ribosomal RNA small subunit methyltransferase G n=1 Tax=Candidatus Caccopulliclostridium gallistercoris TaxID=2840719 RepID=A0A9D1NDU0_9FIRM|nr:16S rRNA (guanine(527)-N(7))-methyltransferase RsmG [Candidatus Caccopulliclostridium gallistercoris]